MFPDSKIAKSFQCARSKGTAIAKEMSALTTLRLVERMKSQPFTISTDGSNDKGGEKLFPLFVRTVNPDTMEVRSDALSVPAIEGSATGEYTHQCLLLFSRSRSRYLDIVDFQNVMVKFLVSCLRSISNSFFFH